MCIAYGRRHRNFALLPATNPRKSRNSIAPSAQKRVGSGRTEVIQKHVRHIKVHCYHEHAHETANGSSERPKARGGVTTPFPLKLHRALDRIEEDGLASVVSWQPHGRCFMVHKHNEFAEHVLPKYFQLAKFASFQRQLNLYGFSRLSSGWDKGGYYHELFLRGKQFLCHRMLRIKVKGTCTRPASDPSSEPDFYSMPSVEVFSIPKVAEKVARKVLSNSMILRLKQEEDDVLMFEGKPFHYLEPDAASSFNPPPTADPVVSSDQQIGDDSNYLNIPPRLCASPKDLPMECSSSGVIGRSSSVKSIVSEEGNSNASQSGVDGVEEARFRPANIPISDSDFHSLQYSPKVEQSAPLHVLSNQACHHPKQHEVQDDVLLFEGKPFHYLEPLAMPSLSSEFPLDHHTVDDTFVSSRPLSISFKKCFPMDCLSGGVIAGDSPVINVVSDEEDARESQIGCDDAEGFFSGLDMDYHDAVAEVADERSFGYLLEKAIE